MPIPRHLSRFVCLCAALWLAVPAPGARSQEAKPMFSIYGFAMVDMGYDFKQNDPSWFDVNRPSRLPAYSGQFGADGRWYEGVRQSKLGVKGSVPTDLGELKTIFEFDMFGVGVDAGQTTIRLRHAYGELGHFGAGQTNSVFMDIDVFPNCLDYWGPNGMLFFRNVQVRWMPIQGDTRMTIALERPGASGDAGSYADRVELQNVKGRFPLPDLSAEYKLGQPWGYIRAGGILRYMVWDYTPLYPGDPLDLSGHAVGWGLNLSSNVNISKDVLRLQVTYGEGVENYFNDAPFDVGIARNPGDPKKPITGKPLPDLGIIVFLDHTWNDRWTSTIGYSNVTITPTDGQSPSAFKVGQYALANFLYSPVSNFTTGIEFQWAQRQNNSDGWTVNDYRIQFGAKYSFSQIIGG
ncbi:MAG TPA: DcaP family trimeric outer membrane transporter [Bacteroidota bacterium]|nr:DcaP family trimeric outer membrane transporter [Bacteroidota bacterium]